MAYQSKPRPEPSSQDKMDALIFCVKTLGISTAITSVFTISLYGYFKYIVGLNNLQEAANYVTAKAQQVKYKFGIPNFKEKEVTEEDLEIQNQMAKYFQSRSQGTNNNNNANE